MAENTRGHRVPNPNLAWSLQQIHRNSHHLASSASQHIHDLHHYVMQGLTPLINHSNMRPVNVPHGHIPWPRGNMSSNPDHIVGDAVAMDYIIDIDRTHDSSNNEMSSDESNRANIEQAAPNERAAELTSELDSLRSTPEFQMLLSFAEKYVPFFLILFMKLMFDHKLGILVIIGLFVTFFHANRVVKREVSNQGKRHLLCLLWVTFNICSCVAIIYSVLAEEKLAYALIFIAPYESPVDLWDVLWVVSITDFVIRMITILVKIFILGIPTQLFAFYKRGKYYLFVECTSQLYRTLAPMQHWLYFFSESYTGPSKVFGVILSAAYLILKCKSLLHKAKMCKNTFLKVLQNRTYGVTPSVSQIKEAGDSCPICQDDYKSPSMLKCKHIFCEDCVSLWFDRERSCPICRAQIADDPSWRDGATSLTLQLF